LAKAYSQWINVIYIFRELATMKILNPFCRQLESLDRLRLARLPSRLNLLRRYTHIFRRQLKPVELSGVLNNGFIAAVLYIFDNRFDNFTNIGFRFSFRRNDSIKFRRKIRVS